MSAREKKGGAPAPASAGPDMVNNPSHYSPNGVDTFMHMKDQMGADAFCGFLQGNVVKYVSRYRLKGTPTQDVCKAAFYLLHLAFETVDPCDQPALYWKLRKTMDHAAAHYGVEGKS